MRGSELGLERSHLGEHSLVRWVADLARAQAGAHHLVSALLESLALALVALLHRGHRLASTVTITVAIRVIVVLVHIDRG